MFLEKGAIMEKIIIANLKMNLTFDEIKKYKNEIEKYEMRNFILAPSTLYLSYLKSDKYELCSQNGYYVDSGAFTGETSFKQLKDIVNYSLIGHSERRNNFNESYEIVSKKIDSCIENKIIPILCVGENEIEKEENLQYDKVSKEIVSALKNKNVDKIIIAYEPIWAMGTGNIPKYEDIENMCNYIKNIVKKYTKNYKIIYGGSVNNKNIIDICKVDGIDGVLIGGASNDPKNIIDMYNTVKKYVK